MAYTYVTKWDLLNSSLSVVYRCVYLYYVSVYVGIHVCMNARACICISVREDNVCTCVGMCVLYAYMYVCMYVCMCRRLLQCLLPIYSQC